MRIAVAISAALHLAVFLIAWIGVLPSSTPLVTPTQVVEVEIAADVEPSETEPPEQPAPKPEAEPKPAPEPPPPPPQRRPPPPEPEVAAKPEPAPEPVPEPEVPIPEPKAEPPKVQPKPAQTAEKKPEPEPEPRKEVRRPSPRPKTKPKPPPKHDFASVLKTVEKLEKQQPPAPKPEKEAEKKKPEKPQDAVAPLEQVAKALERAQPKTPPLRAREGLSASELDAIRRQIEPCWNLPAGARDAESMVVEIRATLNPDGRVRSAVIVDEARARGDAFYRSMAESALRAILNPRCQPLPLPLDKYSEWRDMVIFFDPREMF